MLNYSKTDCQAGDEKEVACKVALRIDSKYCLMIIFSRHRDDKTISNFISNDPIIYCILNDGKNRSPLSSGNPNSKSEKNFR